MTTIVLQQCVIIKRLKIAKNVRMNKKAPFAQRYPSFLHYVSNILHRIGPCKQVATESIKYSDTFLYSCD